MADQQQRRQQGEQQPMGVRQNKGPDDLVGQPGRCGCRHKGEVIGLPQPEPGKERQQQRAGRQQKQGPEGTSEYGAEFQHGRGQLGKGPPLEEATPFERRILGQCRPPGCVLEQGKRDHKQQAGQQRQRRFSQQPQPQPVQCRHQLRHQ